MSISMARRKRTALSLSIAGLMLLVAAVAAISARDPDGITVRTGMMLVTVGAAMWLPWQALLPAVIAVWLGPNIGRNSVETYELFNLNMMLELPGLLGIAAMSTIARISLRDLEQENLLIGMTSDSVGTDPITGVFEESQLRSSLEVELSRSRRFGRTFALVLVGIDELRQRFDYRNEEVWQASFAATADLLRLTRNNVDRVYRFGPSGFALVLPESGPKDVNGLVRRLRRLARSVSPQEGEPGGPLPAHYGATFFPTCATTVDDLLRRAEIALRISDNNASRVQLDGAEAPEMPPVETLRQASSQATAVQRATAEPAADAEPVKAAPGLRIVESDDTPEAEPESIHAVEEPVILADAEPVYAVEEVETPEVEPLYAVEEPGPSPDAEPLYALEESVTSPEVEPLSAVEEPVSLPEAEPVIRYEEPVSSPEAEPVFARQEPSEDTQPQPILSAVEEPASQLEDAGPLPTQLFAVEADLAVSEEQPNYSAHPDAIEVDEEPPFEVFAYRAPEPAVDVYNNYWQAEAPLSVIRRPQPARRLVAIAANASPEEDRPPIDNVLSDALKQLDGTLELIRSLKQRSA